MSRDYRKPDRQSLRLRGYDYTRPGFYFITLNTQDNVHLFGKVVDGIMRPNEFGNIVCRTWYDLPKHYPSIVLDAFVLMPNHMHGIVVLTHGVTLIDPVTGERIVGMGERFVGKSAAKTELFVGTEFKSVPTNTNEQNFHEPSTTIKYPTLGEIVRGLKTFSTRRINELRSTPGLKVWQGRYYDRIARNDGLNPIRWYIANNPRRWKPNPEDTEMI